MRAPLTNHHKPRCSPQYKRNKKLNISDKRKKSSLMQALIQNSNTFLKFAHFIDQMRMNSLISIEFGGETEYTKAVAWFTI